MLSFFDENEIEQLAATVAHEIKNPLSIIMGNVQLLEMDDKKGEHNKHYSIIYRQLDKINELLVEFINITKPQEYDFTKLCMNDLLEDIIFICSENLKAEEITLDYAKPDDRLFIYGDYEKLKQVFVNIIKNSAEAEASKIHITVFRIEGYVVVKLEDNGYGIPERLLEFVGQPFFTTKDSGTGLGVSISKKIVKEHQGVFAISSIEGKGSVVAVTIPEYRKAV